MTLRENFDKMSCKDCDMPYCDVGCTILSNGELDRLEKIADEFAIGFADWIDGLVIEDNNKYCANTTKELLEIYKKEKGL